LEEIQYVLLFFNTPISLFIQLQVYALHFHAADV